LHADCARRKITSPHRAAGRAARRASEETADEPGATRGGRIGLAVALLVFVAGVVRMAGVAAPQLASPYDLRYESPNLATLRLMQAGISPYDHGVYAGPPFTLTPYTPLYFCVMRWLPEAPGRPFLVARLFSLACIAGCALVLAIHARHAAAALLAIGVFLMAWPITAYATYLRMDPLGLLLSALSVLALARPTPRRVALAAVLAVLAVATKQTFLAAGAAGMLFLALRDRRLALRYLVVGAGAAAALAMLATLLWGRGFWFSILLLRSSPVRLDIFWSQAGPQLRSPVFLALLLGAAVALVLGWRRRGAALLRMSPAPLYLLCATAVLVATLGKEGSSALYFMELAFALALLLAEEAADAPGARRLAAFPLAAPRLAAFPPSAPPAAAPPAGASRLPARASRLQAAFLGLLLGCVGADIVLRETNRPLFAFPPNSAERDGDYYAGVRAGLRRAGFESPRVLNLGPPHYAYGIAEDVCMNDVSTYDQAYEQGALDPRTLEAAIRARDYDVVLVTSLATPERMAGRPTAAAIAAVRETYRLLWQDSVYAYYGR
jgi:hypothetical protein